MIYLRAYAEAPLTSRHVRDRAWAAAGAAFLIYVALSLVLWWQVWSGHPATALPCACGDPAQDSWFLAWGPAALAHGQNPFYSHMMFAPGGINMLANASVLGPSLVMAPVTLLWGPIASLNTILLVAPPLAGLAAYRFALKFATALPAFFAGLVYAFCPVVIADLALGHVNLVVGAVWLPLIALILYKILVEPQSSGRQPVVLGLALAGCAIGEFFTSTELLAMAAVMSTVGIVLVCILYPTKVRPRMGYAVRALGSGAVAGLVVLAYPAWFALLGPQHLGQPIGGLLRLAGAPLDGIVARPHLGANSFLAAFGYPGALPSNGAYLGVLPLIVLGAIVVWQFRRPVIRWAAIMAVIAFLLSLGNKVNFDGSATGFTGVHGPFAWLAHLPLVGDMNPARFAFFEFLFVGVILAVGLQGVINTTWRARRTAVQMGVAVTLGSAFVTPMATAWPPSFQASTVRTPGWVRLLSSTDLGPHPVLLSYPLVTPKQDSSLLWQADAGMRWSNVGGYGLVPSAVLAGLAHSVIATRFDAYLKGHPSPATTGELAAARADLARRGVTIIVARHQGADPGGATAFIERVTGHPGRLVGTDRLWLYPASSWK
ncbi:MAG: hypothetical protein ACRD0I_09455 [Acidimicrobiales bacterium]